jgi:NADH-quinone oxidoreductase subunit H
MFPVVALSAAALGAAMLWSAVLRPESLFVGDIVVVIYLLMIPAIMTILGGSASGNPHAASARAGR